MYRYNFIKINPDYKSFGIRNINWKKLYHCYFQMMIMFLIIGIATMIVAIRFIHQDYTWIPAINNFLWFKISIVFIAPFSLWTISWLMLKIIAMIYFWFKDLMSAVYGE